MAEAIQEKFSLGFRKDLIGEDGKYHRGWKGLILNGRYYKDWKGISLRLPEAPAFNVSKN
jgi:hypothetical protein